MYIFDEKRPSTITGGELAPSRAIYLSWGRSRNEFSSLALATLHLTVSSAHAQTQISRIVDSANSFLATLMKNQRTALLFPLNDTQRRVLWSNFPPVSAPQRYQPHPAAMSPLNFVLSPRGFQKVPLACRGAFPHSLTALRPSTLRLVEQTPTYRAPS